MDMLGIPLVFLAIAVIIQMLGGYKKCKTFLNKHNIHFLDDWKNYYLCFIILSLILTILFMLRRIF